MTTADGCFASLAPEGPGASRAVYRVTLEEPVEARATIGSGDAFLAGFVAARYGGRGPEDCLRYGVACGAESTRHLGAGLVDPGQVERLLADITVDRPALPSEVG